MADGLVSERSPGKRRGLFQVLDTILFSTTSLIAVLLVVLGLGQPLGVGRVLLYLLLAPAAGLALHRGFAFIQRRRPGPAIGFAKWLGSPLAAILACAVLEAVIQARGLQVVRADLDPVVRGIAALGKSPPDIQAMLLHSRVVTRVDYFPVRDGFLLVTSGGSIDLEGEVLFYDSRFKVWQRFHRDLSEGGNPAATAFRSATGGTAPIRYERATTGWIRRDPPPRNP